MAMARWVGQYFLLKKDNEWTIIKKNERFYYFWGDGMNIFFDYEQLLDLLNNLNTLTDIQYNIFDIHGKDIRATGTHKPFCRLINKLPEGHARCEACDAAAVKVCSQTRKVHSYRCHAGLWEHIIPIIDDGVPLAYLVFGQLLGEESVEEQWERTRATLDWYPGDMEQLQKAFSELKQYSQQQTTAHAEIMEALAHYIQLKGMIRTTAHTDQQRLERYLDEHYMENLSLESISTQLRIGRTKLCALAKSLSGGSTLTKMIAQRRIRAAKTLLRTSDLPISAVAESVGVNDYNYFSKVFRSETGMTPSAYRKFIRQNDEV